MVTKNLRVGTGMVLLAAAMAPVVRSEDGTIGRSEFDAIKTQVAALRQQVDSLVEHTQNNTTQIAQLSSNLTSMTNEINDQLTKQAQIIKSLSDNTARIDVLQKSIAATDTDGHAFIRLDSIMDTSTTGREQVQRAVNRSLRKQGTVAIHNKMGADQDLLVNGVQYHILAGGTLNLDVAAGTVTTRLPGQEIVNWTISPPGYSQSIDIVPKHQTLRPVRSSPATTTVMMAPMVETPIAETPLYVAPPVYMEPLPVAPLFFYP